MVDENKKTYQWGSTPAIPKNIERDLSYIGRSNFHWDSYFSGNMADFRIYSKPISQDIILQIIKIQRKTMDSGALLNGGGSFGFGGGSASLNIRLNFILNGREAKTISVDQNNRLIWKNQYNSSINYAVGSSDSLKYCSKTGKITVPAKQYMTITPSGQSNFAAPFTIFVVADIKSFKGFKYLFGSNVMDGFELIFDYDNSDVYFSKVGVGGKRIKFNSGASFNPVQIDGNGINIFTITCDANGAFTFYLNSKHFQSSDGDKLNTPPINGGITLGATVLPWNVYGSQDTDLDYYNFMHFTGILPQDWLRIYEAYFACKYKIKENLKDNNNPYYSYNFTWFPF